MDKRVILIHSQDLDKDMAALKKYTTVREFEPYKEVRLFARDGQWHLLIMGKVMDWTKFCKKHRINYQGNSFSLSELKPFFVKVTKCSKFCYPENKRLIGKTMRVMIDPVNAQYYKIYPPLPIQKLCNGDGNYRRKGYIYGIHVGDCVRVDIKPEEEGETTQFVRTLPEVAPERHAILKEVTEKVNAYLKGRLVTYSDDSMTSMDDSVSNYFEVSDVREALQLCFDETFNRTIATTPQQKIH